MYNYYKCIVCQRNDIKLYRWYGLFFRSNKVYCTKHKPNKSQFVPLFEGTDSSVFYGANPYSCKAFEAIDRFNTLPDE